jgi:hypothetical protein
VTAALYTPTTQWAPPEWPVPVPQPEEPAWLEFDRDEPAVWQQASWTCAAASLAWVMNALGVEAPDGGKWDEWVAIQEIRDVGGPGAISPSYGLAYASGVDLERVYNNYGFVVERMLGPDWFRLAYMAGQTIGQLGGARWYHWSGLRGYGSSQFALANPAENWKSVGQELSAYEFDTWGGWNAVMVVGLR